jgi:hypothetical protein
MRRRVFEHQALSGILTEENPVYNQLLPRAPPEKKPSAEEIHYESPGEMAQLQERITVTRAPRLPPSRRPKRPRPAPITTTASNTDQTEPDTCKLYISAKKKQITLPETTYFRQAFYYQLHFENHTRSQAMQFHHFMDRRQITQLALQNALDFLGETNHQPMQIDIISDELEAFRFLEQAKWRVNQTEHAIVGHLRDIGCKLSIKRPTPDDRTYKAIRKKAIEACISSREIRFRTYNKNFVHTTLLKWSKDEFAKIYAAKANPTIRAFFPSPAFIPDYLNTDFVLTQFFTNHGRFCQYLNWVSVLSNKSCPHCPGDQDQTSIHILLHCQKYSPIFLNGYHNQALTALPTYHPVVLVANPQAYKLFQQLTNEIHQLLQIENRT